MKKTTELELRAEALYWERKGFLEGDARESVVSKNKLEVFYGMRSGDIKEVLEDGLLTKSYTYFCENCDSQIRNEDLSYFESEGCEYCGEENVDLIEKEEYIYNSL